MKAAPHELLAHGALSSVLWKLFLPVSAAVILVMMTSMIMGGFSTDFHLLPQALRVSA